VVHVVGSFTGAFVRASASLEKLAHHALVPAVKERILIELMTSDLKRKASRKGSK
jgi:hypothetical protein